MSLQGLAETSCIAHKGSFKSSPENTLESLQEALDLGADGVEFDIRHTKDGRAILMHDSKLNTATSLPGKNCPLKTKINELLFSEIRENCGIEYEARFVKIPLLEEALDLVSSSGKYVFVELKDRPTDLTREIIRQHFYLKSEKLRIIAFDVKNLDILTRPETSDDFWKDVKCLDLDVVPWGGSKGYGVNVWNRLYNLRPWKTYRSKESSVWTLIRPRRIKKFIKQKVDFITTDEVEMCLAFKHKPQIN